MYSIVALAFLSACMCMNPVGDSVAQHHFGDITLDIASVNRDMINYYESSTQDGIYKFYFPNVVGYFIKVMDNGRVIWESNEGEKCTAVFSCYNNSITQLSIHVSYLGGYVFKYYTRENGSTEWEPMENGDPHEEPEGIVDGWFDDLPDDLIIEDDWDPEFEHRAIGSPTQIVPEGPGYLIGSFYIEELDMNGIEQGDRIFPDDDSMHMYVMDSSHRYSPMVQADENGRQSPDSTSESSDYIPRKRFCRTGDASTSREDQGDGVAPPMEDGSSDGSHLNLENGANPGPFNTQN